MKKLLAALSLALFLTVNWPAQAFQNRPKPHKVKKHKPKRHRLS